MEFFDNHALRRVIIDLSMVLDIRSMFSDLDETEWQAFMFTLAWLTTIYDWFVTNIHME